jgi:hypothetical protein
MSLMHLLDSREYDEMHGIGTKNWELNVMRPQKFSLQCFKIFASTQ